jgi:hypothetical protein
MFITVEACNFRFSPKLHDSTGNRIKRDEKKYMMNVHEHLRNGVPMDLEPLPSQQPAKKRSRGAVQYDLSPPGKQRKIAESQAEERLMKIFETHQENLQTLIATAAGLAEQVEQPTKLNGLLSYIATYGLSPEIRTCFFTELVKALGLLASRDLINRLDC